MSTNSGEPQSRVPAVGVGRVQQRVQPLLGNVRHRRAWRVRRLVRGDRRAVDPLAVDVSEEVRSGLHGGVGAREVNSPRAVLRSGHSRGLRGETGRGGERCGDRAKNGEGETGEMAEMGDNTHGGLW